MTLKQGAEACCDSLEDSDNLAMSETGTPSPKKQVRVKPSLSVQLELEEEAKIRALMDLTGEDNRSEMGRILMALGAAEVKKNPDRNWRKVKWPPVEGEDAHLPAVKAQWPGTARKQPQEPETHFDPADASPGVTSLANEMRDQQPHAHAIVNPEGKGGKPKGEPHRGKGVKAPGPSKAGKDTAEERRERGKG